MSAPDPLKSTNDTLSKSTVSSKQFVIAGILTTVYGLAELQEGTKHVACLWLLHPRLSSQARMAPVAQATITHWNKRSNSKNTRALPLGMIAVSFDQRNHGSREVDAVANEAWKSGNPRHAQDMFSIYQGTAADTSQLITYLGAYIFPGGQRTLVEHMVLGVSLGGHACWHCVLHDRRISTGVVVIGCPDYLQLMKDRARLTKLRSWTETPSPGSAFVGSRDFPPDLVAAVEAYDPAGLFLGLIAQRSSESYTREPSDEEKKTLIPLMRQTLQGKRILNLSGKEDKLVPYAQSQPFLDWLKNATCDGPLGWFGNSEIVLRDLIFDGVGHAMTPAMVDEAINFIAESLEQIEGRLAASVSKI